MASIKREIIYPFPIDLVWEAISSREALSSWLMETDFEPVVGKKFTFTTKPSPGFDGIVKGEVLVVEPPHQLTYSWRNNRLKSTTVSFKLQEVKEGTKLTFEHAGFTGMGEVVPQVILRLGWRGLLKDDVRQWLEARAKGDKS